MRPIMIICWLFFGISTNVTECQENIVKSSATSIDYIVAFKDTLVQLSENSDNDFFKMHCNSMLAVVNSKSTYTSADSVFIQATYNAFNNLADTSNSKELSSYLKRQRPLIFSWVSPTDGAVSFSRIKLPKNWDPQTEYPVYIQLHGLSSSAVNPVEYVTKPFRDNPSSTFSYEDGYMISPWGRGNFWYQGISETDIWECLEALEEIVKIDPSRKYITGHSMGGYGAWSIASKSANTWAALGIHAGALWYSPNLVNTDVAIILRDMPTYFVCGTNDGLLGINQTAYGLLEDAGNENIEFVTFTGGHEYVEENVENMYLWMREFVNDDWQTDMIKSPEITHNKSNIICFPNPVNDIASINYSISDNLPVNVSIYDIYGRFIAELVDEADISGEYAITYDASELSNGIYIVRLKSGNSVSESKIVLVK